VQKQAPTPFRLATMAMFALSCFALLLFLWLSFGGPTPLKPKGYRFEVAFPEATQLAAEADVRVAGVQVGKVRQKRKIDQGNRTIATIEIDSKYAPISRNARAQLRTKAILGETYVELTLGRPEDERLAEGERLSNRNIGDATQLDEILNALDPYTRRAFRTWQQELAVGVRHRGQDLNDSFGNLPGFVDEGGDLFEVLDEQRAALRGLVRNTGVVFGALTERESQLRALVENTDSVFTAIGSQKDSWAETWRIMPTFLEESRLTFNRLNTFSKKTDPLVVELKPAIENLGPTLESVGDFAPDLKRFFNRLDPLITVSKTSLPQTKELLDGLRPLLGELGPWLSNLNPILDWVGHHENTLTDMFANLGVSQAAKTKGGDDKAVGHYLRQIGPTGTETVSFWPRRLPSNRGNAYWNPLGLVSPELGKSGIQASHDCINAGGPKDAGGVPPSPPCREEKPYTYRGRTDKFERVTQDDYSAKP
jgi:virulence factor Mce-like protein